MIGYLPRTHHALISYLLILPRTDSSLGLRPTFCFPSIFFNTINQFLWSRLYICLRTGHSKTTIAKIAPMPQAPLSP